MESRGEPIIRTEHLSRIVDGTRLVDDLSVAVQPRETLAVVGPSGAGKSSFLRLLNRLDEPTDGTVYFHGRDYREIPPRELRRRISLLMQTPHLFPGTVADNVRFGPRQRGEELPGETVESFLTRVNLPGYADRNVGTLSGGEAQRVALARTLANSPEVLLLDEPTSALDDASERDVERLLCSILREHGLTCVIVTHDTAQAERIADRAMLMKAGRLVTVGPVTEVLHAE